MHKLKCLRFLIISLTVCVLPSLVVAEPQYRGFQVALSNINSELLEELSVTWGSNVVRIQIGNEEEMDGTTGDAYLAMMEEQFDLLDSLLPLFETYNMKFVFALYSPPGGFATRVAPAHYAMFSQASLQDDYIAIWLEILERYSGNPSILGFDLLNEPAMRQSMLGSGARTWKELSEDTISAIRAEYPSVTLFVKSLYGNPVFLTGLPILNDANLVYSYHAYPFLKYQHSGIAGTPVDLPRPSAATVKAKLLAPLAGFLAKVKKEGGTFPPRLNVGEIGVSACAPEGGQFLADILSVLERDDLNTDELKANKKKKKKKKNNKKKDPAQKFLNLIEHESYTIHSYGDASIWNPTYNCAGSDGSVERSLEETERTQILLDYFGRN